MKVQDVIARKRDGERHTRAEIEWLVGSLVEGSVKDYQAAAWLMAVYLNGLDDDETAWLTQAMADSGARLDLSKLPRPWVDKHSTGGVGDKTTLVVAPLLASAGMTVIKMSGRGLGITGGTLDKLSSIPGFRTDLPPTELLAQAQRIGIALAGQSMDLAPADGILYSIRDTTATIDSVPLIVSSILSKKIAGGADTIVIDVKCGSGAFVRDLSEAQELESSLKRVANRCGIHLEAAITDMSQPLGKAIGNALEVREAISILRDQTPGRFKELCLGVSALALCASGKEKSRQHAYARAQELLESGAALNKFNEWITAQGGPSNLCSNVDGYLPAASVVQNIRHKGNRGWVSKWDAGEIGRAVVRLGGGRGTKTDSIDTSVGIVSEIHVGSEVVEGDPLYTIHASSEKSADVARISLEMALELSPKPVEQVPLFLSEGP